MNYFLLKLAFILKASFLVLQVVAQSPSFGLRYEEQKATQLWVINTGKVGMDARYLQVFIQGNSQQMLMDQELRQDTLWCTPIFPFNAKLMYEIRLSGEIFGNFQPKTIIAPPSRLTLYPQATSIPANVLKMQLVFSSPMQVGNSYQYIQMFTDTGNIQPFLELQPELWNEDKTILTLWLDPGRIKRELIRSKKLGAPLEQGRVYTMAVSKEWPTQNGQTLDQAYQKKLFMLPPNRQRLAPKKWTTTQPSISTKEALQIDFGQPMDYLLLHHAITIYHQENPIIGKVDTLSNETIWTFIPDKAWQAGTYQLVIESRLEDLAGNTINYAFDREIDRQETGKKKEVIISFVLK